MSFSEMCLEFFTKSFDDLVLSSCKRACACSSVRLVYVLLSCRCSDRTRLMHSCLSRIAGPRFLSHIKITKSLFLQRMLRCDYCKFDKLEEGFDLMR